MESKTALSKAWLVENRAFSPFENWFHAGFRFSWRESRLMLVFLSKSRKTFSYRRRLQKENENFSYLALLLFCVEERGVEKRKKEKSFTIHTLAPRISAHFNSFSGELLIAWVAAQRTVAILMARQKELKWYFIILLGFLLCRHHTRCVRGTIIISNLISFWFASLRRVLPLCM